MGYLLVFLSYVVIGVSGYFGFMGVAFAEYAMQASGTEKPLAQNCMLMLGQTNIAGFIMRTIVFCLVFSSFPILNHFFRSGVLKIVYGGVSSEGDSRGTQSQLIPDRKFKIITAVIILIPLFITVVYPQIAGILGYVGSVGGLFIVYIMPVVTYLVKLKHQCDNPILNEAHDIQTNYLNKKLYQDE